jgi:uncharacterized membrane protein
VLIDGVQCVIIHIIDIIGITITIIILIFFAVILLAIAVILLAVLFVMMIWFRSGAVQQQLL